MCIPSPKHIPGKFLVSGESGMDTLGSFVILKSKTTNPPEVGFSQEAPKDRFPGNKYFPRTGHAIIMAERQSGSISLSKLDPA